jgi:hypothetical protein
MLNPTFARAAVLGLALLTGACTAIGASSPTPPAGAQTPPPTEAPTSTPSTPSSPSSPSSPQVETPTPSSSAIASAASVPSGITEAQAIAVVQAFAPHATGLQVTESDTVPAGRSYRVQSADIMAEVDQATGEVRMFIDNAAMPTSTVVKLTKDEALMAASAWLTSHGVATTGLSPTTTLMDHGSTQEFAVDFGGRVNGARIPHRVNVSIDPATGSVYAFVLYTRPFVTPPAPKLTADAAAAAARNEEQDPGANVTATDLAIDFDAAGTQELVYELDLTRTDGFYVKVQVDALTGSVTVMGRG